MLLSASLVSTALVSMLTIFSGESWLTLTRATRATRDTRVPWSEPRARGDSDSLCCCLVLLELLGE